MWVVREMWMDGEQADKSGGMKGIAERQRSPAKEVRRDERHRWASQDCAQSSPYHFYHSGAHIYPLYFIYFILLFGSEK